MDASNDTQQFLQAMRRGENLIFVHVAACVVLMLASTMASAGSLAVSPLRLTFTHGAGIVAVTVENNSREESLVQAEVLSWAQPDGEAQLAPTEDVVAVPPVFKLAPGASQRIRVGLTRPFESAREETYRLIVTEVPTAPKPGTVAVAVRHSLPIFIQPAGAISPKIAAKRLAPDRLELTNTGSQHVRIHRWRFKDTAGIVQVEATGPGYILPASRVVLSLPAGTKGVGSLEAEQESGTLKLTVGD